MKGNKGNKDVTVNQLSIGLWNTQLIMIDKRNAVIGAVYCRFGRRLTAPQ
jgi:hypothetical protein